MDFNRIAGEIVYSIGKQDFPSALRKIEEALDNAPPQSRAQCLLYRGNIRLEQGLKAKARADWLTALADSRSGSYLRYTLELQLGFLSQDENRDDEAASFFGSAINSCVSGEDFSANRALSAVLALDPQNLCNINKEIIGLAVKKSWSVLELSGTPDLTDLPMAIAKLSDEFEDLLRKTIGS